MAFWNGKGSLLSGIASALGASVCCVAPLLLVSLGIGGAWIGNLTALEPYRPLFIGLTLLFLGLAFRQLYLVPRPCTTCIDANTRTRERRTFWIAALLALGLLATPWLILQLN